MPPKIVLVHPQPIVDIELSSTEIGIAAGEAHQIDHMNVSYERTETSAVKNIHKRLWMNAHDRSFSWSEFIDDLS